jgi:hypothetical protein
VTNFKVRISIIFIRLFTSLIKWGWALKGRTPIKYHLPSFIGSKGTSTKSNRTPNFSKYFQEMADTSNSSLSGSNRMSPMHCSIKYTASPLLTGRSSYSHTHTSSRTLKINMLAGKSMMKSRNSRGKALKYKRKDNQRISFYLST